MYAGPGHPDFPDGKAGPKWRGHGHPRSALPALKRQLKARKAALKAARDQAD